MAWIEAHQALRDHRKVLALAERLGMPEPHAVGHVLYLWLWAIDNAPDGRLPTSNKIIERAAAWLGEPGAFVEALEAVGLIDWDDGDYCLHDWQEYGGRLSDRRKANAERQKRFRERHRDVTPRTDAPKRNVTVTSPSRNGATQHNSTQHNTTNAPLTPQPQPEPTPAEQPPPVSAAKGIYLSTLNGSLPQIGADFKAVDPELGAGWLRNALRDAEPKAGPLGFEQIVGGLELAILRIERAVANAPPDSPHKIRNVRGFAAGVIAESLMEQAHAQPP